MNRVVFGTGMALAVTAVLAAHDKNAQTGKMAQTRMEKAYSGCLERTAAGSYQLTSVTAVHEGAGKMRDSGMKADSHMKADGMKADGMKGENMHPGTLALSAARVDLGKHVGHKVTVMGTDVDSMKGMMPAFNVTSLKMIASSCS